ncbi:tautomerase family protein [Pseudomonas saponiphila]|uniref:tautomerase family protein n=1 Tax=Pseudomonas saponiphila TaxID=556534 RepID=UPI00223E96BB|nr:tautomerase family protein [Pseudomonas saponiphila]
MLQDALLKSVSQAIATSLEISIDSVRVIIQDIPENQWAAGDQTLAQRRAGEKEIT